MPGSRVGVEHCVEQLFLPHAGNWGGAHCEVAFDPFPEGHAITRCKSPHNFCTYVVIGNGIILHSKIRLSSVTETASRQLVTFLSWSL